MTRGARRAHLPDLLILRIGFAAVGSWLLQVGFRIYPAASTRVWLVPVLFALYLMGLTAFWTALTPSRWLRLGRTLILLGLLVGVTAGLAVEVLVYARGYDADGLVFSHIAAERTLARQNPYTIKSESVLGEFERFGLSASFVTPTVDGRPFDGLVAYPALHFLIYIPALAAGLKDLRWVTLVFELASLWVLFRFSNRRIQPLVILPLLVNADLILRFPAGSGTDWIWVLPLLLTVVLLAHNRTALAGAAFGTACAVSQLAWGATPFLGIWLLKTMKRNRSATRAAVVAFFGAATAAFLLPNLPFMALDFPSWLGGVLTPMRSSLVYDGQGLSLLSKMGLLPLSREFYGVLVLLLGLAGVATYWVFFPALRRALWAYPATLMWFAYRSLHNYLIFWLPIALLWLTLSDDAGLETIEARADQSSEALSASKSRSRGVAVSALVGVIVAASLTAFAFGSTPGISWRVLRLEDRYRLGAVDAIVVEVTNRTPAIFEPVFSVMQWGFPIGWKIERGTEKLKPGEMAVYLISAPEAHALLLPQDGPLARQSGMPAPSYLRLEVQGVDGRRPQVEIAPAYLRLNDKTKYPVYTIRLSGYTAHRPETLNPEFRYWRIQDRTTLRSAPIGWLVEARPADNAHAQAREQTIEGRRTASLILQPRGQPGWEHVGLRQDVAGLVCIAVSAYFTRPFRFQDGNAIEAQGIELSYRNRAVWYVFSNEHDAQRSIQLSNGSKILTVPRRPHTWSDIVLDVRPEIEGLGGAGRLVSVKAFVALNERPADTLAPSAVMHISRLEASSTSCSGSR